MSRDTKEGRGSEKTTVKPFQGEKYCLQCSDEPCCFERDVQNYQTCSKYDGKGI